MIDYEAAYIEVKKNSCGFVPAMIKIQGKVRSDTSLNFGNIVTIDSPSISIPF